ncbi:aerobic glycerol-3-phosphate dehydrogenase [Staphylococcus aureus]|nr:aerobic glycerol-3-phosphate dehydrogenase [Staphylococcus aureus]
MVHKPTDFLVRRSGRLYFDIQYVLDHKDAIVEVMAQVLNYDNDTKRVYKDELEQAIKEAVNPNDQPAIVK